MTPHRFVPTRLLCTALLCALAACARNATPDATADTSSPSPEAAAAPKVGEKTCALIVRSAWIRLVPGDMPMDAGYAVIHNPCDVPVVVTGATSPAYADVTLHESMLQQGMSRMRPVDALRIEPHGHVELKPGSYHLMLMAPRVRPTAGQRVTVVFQLQDGHTAAADFEPRSIAP